jgi:chemotaxis protein CheZ
VADTGSKYLAAARTLVASIEAGDGAAVEKGIDELTNIRETALFKELGVLTRELHESIKAFKLDTRLSDIASTEIPDARERLNYVISMTDQAAHRTLTAIEESVPLVSGLTAHSVSLHTQWRRFRNRDLSVEAFRQLSRDLDAFLEQAVADGARVQSHLGDALMAQDFQDLTGQIIRRVINLVQEVEENLVQLVRISGARMGEEKPEAADNRKEDRIVAEGPRIPGRATADLIQGQDDVDDLLSSLGF